MSVSVCYLCYLELHVCVKFYESVCAQAELL